MITKQTSNKSKSSSGFSLIEVTISLGIISFGLVTVLGLVPAAVEASREAMDMTVKTQIYQQVVSDLNSADFAGLQDESFYFDLYGGRVDSESDSIYEARIDVTTGTTLPGASANNSNLSRVQILIAHNPKGARGEDAFDLENTQNPPILMSTLISRKDKI